MHVTIDCGFLHSFPPDFSNHQQDVRSEDHNSHFHWHENHKYNVNITVTDVKNKPNLMLISESPCATTHEGALCCAKFKTSWYLKCHEYF